MNGRTLTLASLAGLAVAGFVAQRRGSRDQDPTYAFRASMEQAIGGFPEGKLPLSKWREGFLSRGVVQEQLDTRGFLSYLAERQRQGVKSLAKAEVIAWLAANPYGLLETWRGDFGLKMAAEQRAIWERASAVNEAKRLLVAHGSPSAGADLLLGSGATLAVSVGNDILRWDKNLPTSGRATSVAFSPNGRILAVASTDHTVTLWRVADGTLSGSGTLYTGLVNAVAFSLDGSALATGGQDGVALWRMPYGQKIELRDAHDRNLNEIHSVAFSPDGRTLATGSLIGTVALWQNGAEIVTLAHTGYAPSVAFSPDGRILATGSRDGVALWRVSDGVKLITGEALGALTLAFRLPHVGSIASVAFSPDGRTLATGGFEEFGVDNNVAALWSVPNGEKLATLPHIGLVDAIAFSPDGRFIAASGRKNTGLYRVADGTQIATMMHDEEVRSVAFSPDSQFLATGYWDKTTLWRMVPSTEPLARALLHLPAPLRTSAPTWQHLLSTGHTGYRELLLQLPPRAGTPPFVGGTMGSHWPEPDVLVHARLTLRPIKGKGQALFADEIQSDWHQGLAGRKPGIRPQSLPPAPFADEWEKLMLKRLLLYAAETKADALVLTDGATIAPLVDPRGRHHASIATFYDGRLARLFESLVGGLGGVVEPISVKIGYGFKAFPGVRMTDALRTRLGQGVGYWGRT